MKPCVRAVRIILQTLLLLLTLSERASSMPPVLDLDVNAPNSTNTTVVFQEEQGRVRLFNGSSHSVSASASVSQVTLALLNRPNGFSEYLEFAQLPGIPVVVQEDFAGMDSSGTLFLMGNFSSDAVVQILTQVYYVNSDPNPHETRVRAISITIEDDTGQESEAAFISLFIEPYNNAPTVSLGGPGLLNYTTVFLAGGACVSLASFNLQISDADSLGIASVLVSLQSSGSDVNEFLLFEGNAPNTTYFLSPKEVVMVLSNPSFAMYEEELPKIVYCNTADQPDSTTRIVSVIATDLGLLTYDNTSALPAAYSQPAHTIIEIPLVNNPPTLYVEPAITTGGSAPTAILLRGSTRLTDIDSIRFLQIRISLSNAPDGPDDEIILFDNQLPPGQSLVGPRVEGSVYLYTYIFEGVGGTRDNVTEVLESILYQNQNPNINTTAVRHLCLQVNDSESLSNQVCVDLVVAASSDNMFSPVFLQPSYNFTVTEVSSYATVGNVVASDSDIGRSGQVLYTIAPGLSPLLNINSSTGEIMAPFGLDADTYADLVLNVMAVDLGNPARTATAQVFVQLVDINDNSPQFVFPDEGPAYSVSITEHANSTITVVKATDADVTSPNNLIEYSLVGAPFGIDPANGDIAISDLDYETVDQYMFTVYAQDSGVVSLTSTATVTLTVIDINDNPTGVDVPSTVYYLLQHEPVAQQPIAAAQLSDIDHFDIQLAEVNITLSSTGNVSRPYSTCLEDCQDERVTAAGLTASTELTSIAEYFEGGDNISAPEVLIGDGGCSAIHLSRGAAVDGSEDTYGRISSTSLPPGFGGGEYSISFVANITDAGYIFLAVDTDDPFQPHSRVNFEVGLQIASTTMAFEYIHGPSRTPGTFEYTLSSTDYFGEFFSTGVGTTRHYVLVINSNPTPAIDVYVDCALLVSAPLDGTVAAPDVQFGLFLGQSVPNPIITDGRLSGAIHGLYYHPYALNDSQISDFCLCGEEYLNIPTPLPETISLTADNNHVSFTTSDNFSAIPASDVVQALRQVEYVNTFSVPTTGQPPDLIFTVTDVDEQVDTSSTQITFLSQGQAPLPLLDLNGPDNTGGNHTVTFMEAFGPVPLVSTNATLVWDGLQPEAPTFTEVGVELVGAVEPGETLASTSTDHITVVPVNASGFLLVGPGTATEFLEALQSITYDNTNPRLSSTEKLLQFSVYDIFGGANDPLVYTVIGVQSINQAPVISNLPTSVAYEEGSTVIVAPNLTLSDTDSENVSMAMVTIFSPTEDNLSVSSATPAVETSFSGQTLTITGEASLSDYQLLLRSLQYSSSDNPVLDEQGALISTAANRSIQISITDADGATYTAELPITFQPVNDPPAVVISTVELLFNGSSQSALPVVPYVSISDPDSVMWQSMRVALDIAVDGDYLDDGSTASRVLIYGPTNSLENYSMILQSITYNNPQDIPTPVPRTITVDVCDFQNCGSALVTIAVDPLVCQLNNCLNGGTCMEGVGLESSCNCETRFTGDVCEEVVPTSLESLIFDLDSGELSLVFQFPVNTSTLNISAISFQDTETLPTNTFTLTGVDSIHEGLALQDNVTLLASDLNAIKAIEGLASSELDTFLSLREGVYLDDLGQPVAAIPVESALPVAVYIPDSTSPTIVSFDLLETLQDGVSLVLFFTETVLPSSLMPSGLTLLTAPSSNISYQLTGGTSTLANSPQIAITLTTDDVTAIRENFYPLGTSPAETYISASAFTITDTAGNFLQVDAPLAAGTVTADFVPPTIISFSLDMDSGVLSLTFSEAVRSSTLNLSLISLHSASGDQMVMLGSGNISTESSDSSVSIALSNAEVDSLKVSSDLASNVNNTFLAAEAGYVVDTAGNIARDTIDSLPVTELQVDMTSPVLESFTFDLDNGEMVLTFNEPVNETSLAAHQLVLTNTTAAFSPTFAVINSLTPRTISISLSPVDLNQVKEVGICLSESTCKLYFPGSPGEIVGTDYAGNILIEIPSSSSIPVTSFVDDTTSPQLFQFLLDLNTGTIELVFSEPIALSSVDPTQITLHDRNTSEESNNALTLTGGSLGSRNNSDRVHISTTIDNLNALKHSTELCTNSSNCHIAITESLATDVSGNIVVSQTLPVDEFVEDTTPPVLVSFDLDLTTPTITLYFDEPVVPYTFHPPLVTLQNAAIFPLDSYGLLGGELLSTNIDTFIPVALIQGDIQFLQFIPNLATGPNDTFLSIGSGIVEDTSGNLAQSTPEAIQVRVYTEDSVAPEIVSVDLLDMNVGRLVFSMSEPVSDDVNVNGITICSSVACNVTTYTLTSATSTYTHNYLNYTIALVLDSADVIALKLLSPVIATTELNSLVTVLSGTFRDTAGNANVPLSTAQPVDTYINDATPPTLLDFTLDFNNDHLNLNFDDVISAESLDPLGITIQGAENDSTSSVQLTGGTSLAVNGIEITLELNSVDLNAIISNPALGTATSNTFITIAEGTVLDVAGNPVSATSGLQAGTVVLDNPLLLRVDFDLNYGILSLSFSEDVDPDSFNITEITLLNMPNGTHSYQLTGGSVLTSEASNRTDIELSSFDLNSIKALPLLATSQSNTYVSLTVETVADLEGNRVVPVSSSSALQATTFTVDTTRPHVVSFDLLTGSVVLAVTFTETINASSVDVTGFMLLQSLNANASDAITLTGGNVGPENSPQIWITLTDFDVERIRGRLPLGSFIETTYLSLSPTAVADMSGNVVSPPSPPLQVTVITADFVPPDLLNFILDVNSGTLTLDFTEDIPLSSVSTFKFFLQDELETANTRTIILLTRSQVNVPADITTQVELSLSESVQDSVKISGIGASTSNAFVSLSRGAVTDALGNPIGPTTFQALDVITDTTPPALSGFSINLDGGQMLVTFSEPVLLSSLKLADLVLSTTSPSSDGATFSPSTSDAILQSTRQILIQFSNSDLNEVKQLEICIQRASCYLSLSPNATIVDYANQTVHIFEPLQVTDLTRDMTPPTVSSVMLDMDRGTLEFGFSEPVNVTSFSATELRLQNSPGANFSSSYTLTGGPSQGNTTIVTLFLRDPDLNAVKANDLLCIGLSTCYVHFGTGLIDDVSGNPNALPSQAHTLSGFMFDSTQPHLITFDLDLNTGVITLFFDETVNSATFLPGELTLQNSPVPTASVQMSNGTPFDGSVRSDILSFTILTEDIIRIQTALTLATGEDNTFLSIPENTISDTSDNRLVDSGPLPVGTYTVDSTLPQLSEFSTLDMDEGLIELSFSEPVITGDVDLNRISLCSSPECSTSVSLSNASHADATEATGLFLQISVSTQDIYGIKKEYPDLASSLQSTWIDLESGAFADTAGNLVLPTTANVNSYQADRTQPNLLDFHMDANQGRLVLEFDDVMNTSSIMANSLRLQNSRRPSESVLLSSETRPFTEQLLYDNIVEFVLGENDLTIVRRHAPNLATSADNTYLSLTVVGDSFFDVFGNQLNGINESSALQASSVTPFVLECQNGGVFIPGNLECECEEGYNGTLCEIDLDVCPYQDPCNNGGTCIEGVGAMVTCSCPEGYSGVTCNFRTDVVLCPPELNAPLYPGSSFVRSWNESEVGVVLTQDCPMECRDVVDYAEGAEFVRTCLEVEGGVGSLTVVNLADCQLSRTGLELCEAGQELDETSVVQVSNTVANITSNVSRIDSAAVSVASNIIEDITQSAIDNTEVRDNYFRIVDNIISADRETLVQSQQETSSSSRILESLNTFTSEVPINTTSTEPQTFTATNFGILLGVVNTSRFTGEAFSASLGDDNHVNEDSLVTSNATDENATASAEVPASIFDGSEEDLQRLTYSIFLLNSLFLTPETDCNDFGIASAILSVNISAANISIGSVFAANLSEGILLTFQQLEQVCNRTVSTDSRVQCANFETGDAGRTGRWTTEHCTKITERSGRTICRCQQLGHFGLLFDLNPGDSVSPLALSIISYAGASLSTILLIVIIATYLFSKKLRTAVHGQLLVQLSLALIGLYVTFIAAGQVTSISEVCATVAALLHYFVLAFFGWTAAESIYLYRKLVTVLTTEIKHYTLKAAAIVWVVPAVIVGAAAGAGNEYYSNPYFCRPTDYPFYFAFILPFCILYVFDWVMFVVIMVSLFRRAYKAAKLTAGEKRSTDQVKKFTIIAIGLSVVFGLGWGLGLAATTSDIEELTFVFQLLFSIFVGSQGILIFILHGLRSKEARSVWKAWFCISTGKSIDFSDSAGKDARTLRSQRTDSSSAYRLSTLRRESQTSMGSIAKDRPMSSMSMSVLPEVDEAAEKNPTQLGSETTPVGIDVIENAGATAEQQDATPVEISAIQNAGRAEDEETTQVPVDVIENMGAMAKEEEATQVKEATPVEISVIENTGVRAEDKEEDQVGLGSSENEEKDESTTVSGEKIAIVIEDVDAQEQTTQPEQEEVVFPTLPEEESAL